MQQRSDVQTDQQHLSTDVDKSVNYSNSGISVDVSSLLWNDAVSSIRSKITPQNFDLWFRPIRCLGIDGSQVTLLVPNRFIKDWFEGNYLSVVFDEMRTKRDQPYFAFWLVDDRSSWSEDSITVQSSPIATEESSFLKETVEKVSVSASSTKKEIGLLARYTFDTFVVGPSNQLAEAASRAVAQMPGAKYNPLFLYGGVGLGKTHLLHAIGHQIQSDHPDWNVAYVKTETFLNEYIYFIRNNRIDEFRDKYRKSIDILLMDDIQYLGGKERTQDEFFHTFNALFESGKQIIVTADQYPHQIPDLEERIRSRFQWGLVADIHPPELETRMAILVRKADYENIDLPPEVAYYLASNIRSNVRELEGLLLRVAVTASLHKQKLNVDFAQETLKHFLSQTAALVTVEKIQRLVASFFKISVDDLKSTRRQQAIARPRQMAMYLSRKWCKTSYPELGSLFGNKDHTTVLAACRKSESLLASDDKFKHYVGEIEKMLL